MKKLLKISFLAGILMFIFAIKSNAAASKTKPVYSKLNADGSMDVTITFINDPSENEDFLKTLQEDKWEINGKVATKNVENVDKKPFFKHYWFSIGDDSYEEVYIATPFIINVGDTYNLSPDAQAMITSSSNEDVVSYTRTSITGKSNGKSTITLSELVVGITPDTYEWEITVADSTTPTDPATPSSGNYSAKYEGNKLIISGLTDGEYRYFVDTNSTADNSSSISTTKLDKENSDYVSEGMLDSLALNQDIYAHVYTADGSSLKDKVADIKITKPTFNDANYFTEYTDATYIGCLFKLNLPYHLKSTDVTRKIHYKIGRITDNSVLLSIKNSDSDSFGELMQFAKDDSSAVFDETLEANDFNGYSGKINVTGQQLVDNAYYYLYAELDTENGKYLPLSSVTLAKASVYPTMDYSWYMFFYGSDKFNFDGISDSGNNGSSEDEKKEEDKKKEADSNLAKAGESHIILAILVVGTVSAIVIYRKNKSTKIK